MGDVVGKRSCEAIRRILPKLKAEYQIGLTVANGENSADGNGITPYSAEHLFTSGVDIITGGNHTLHRKECYEMLDTNPYMTRPANLCDAPAGKGLVYYDFGPYTAAVINLSGTVFMPEAANAFEEADRLIESAKQNGAKIILLDFHAEVTSEKCALGQYTDGRITAFFGTHTHVQTSDIGILPNGTGYITDLGMCGPYPSVLGVDSNIIIRRFMGKTDEKFQTASTPIQISGCVFSVDPNTGKTVSCQSFTKQELV